MRLIGCSMLASLFLLFLGSPSFSGGGKVLSLLQGEAVTNPGDGAASAPADGVRLPTLLNGYAVRPAWNVAGVDYGVGYAGGAALLDPSAISMVGASVDKIRHVVTISGNNVALSGYDFSSDGGWGVSVSGGTNATIANSNFRVGSNGNIPIFIRPEASNVTIQGNLIDGESTSMQILVAANGAGTTIIRYNHIKNAWGQNIVLSADAGGENWIIQYNLIENAGLGFGAGAHGDWIQSYNLPGKNTDSFHVDYNTFLQNVPIARARTQGISAFSANSGPASGGVQTESFNNNTFIANNGAYVNFAIILDRSRLIGAGTIQNNYFDITNIGSANGGGGGWSFVGNYNGPNGGPYNGKVDLLNNVNMVTGTYFKQTAVSIRRVVASPISSSAGSDRTIIFKVDLSAAVTVSGGTPTLVLENGDSATYIGGSGTASLNFSYRGAPKPNGSPLVATLLKLNGAVVKNNQGQIANLALDGVSQTGPEQMLPRRAPRNGPSRP